MTGGKCLRGLAVVQSYMTFRDNDHDLQAEHLKLVAILGILMEMVTKCDTHVIIMEIILRQLFIVKVQAWLAIADDIVDGSQMRRGLPCWYLEIGLGAINDACLISKLKYHLLRKYFGHLDCHSKLVETFLEVDSWTYLQQISICIIFHFSREN